LSYEIRTSFLLHQEKAFTLSDDEEYPIVDETERFYQHFENALKATGFIVPSHPGLVLTKLRRLFNRARPDVKELKMMRGILASVERAAKASKTDNQTD
jgi:tRNA (cytidine32/uridine32-2'-O)-methyltransferase